MHALYVQALASDGARSFGLSSVAKTLLCLEDLLAGARWSSKPTRALPRSPSNRHRSIKNFFWALHSKKAYWSAVRLAVSTNPPYFHALDPVVCLSLATFTGDTLLAGHTDTNLGLGVDSNTVFIHKKKKSPPARCPSTTTTVKTSEPHPYSTKSLPFIANFVSPHQRKTIPGIAQEKLISKKNINLDIFDFSSSALACS